MKWAQVKHLITSKLNGVIVHKKAHEQGRIPRGDGTCLGTVRIGRHTEMKPWEIQGCATKFRISLSEFVRLEGCTISKEEYFRMAQAKMDYLIRPV